MRRIHPLQRSHQSRRRCWTRLSKVQRYKSCLCPRRHAWRRIDAFIWLGHSWGRIRLCHFLLTSGKCSEVWTWLKLQWPMLEGSNEYYCKPNLRTKSYSFVSWAGFMAQVWNTSYFVSNKNVKDFQIISNVTSDNNRLRAELKTFYQFERLVKSHQMKRIIFTLIFTSR